MVSEKNVDERLNGMTNKIRNMGMGEEMINARKGKSENNYK